MRWDLLHRDVLAHFASWKFSDATHVHIPKKHMVSQPSESPYLDGFQLFPTIVNVCCNPKTGGFFAANDRFQMAGAAHQLEIVSLAIAK